ncbi:MAG: thymidine phosphorylase [Nitrospiraceae bacterium]|nr:thymidine phosphorylase [Nitrospiraceae bacterium]
MRAYDLIKKKRDNKELTREDIEFLITGFLTNKIPDYQISSFLMAVYFNGMSVNETSALTEHMLNSGRKLDLSDISLPKIDKHSTGGVGDKISLILAPLVASSGITIPMIAGRGLGHTGGTIDKLESIPELRTNLSVENFIKILKNIGFSIISQTDDIAPADKKLYGLRDVTATVESIPLIAASIMSKKLAEGINGLVLDVKCGSGAFMKNIHDAKKLARTMVDVGNSAGVKTAAIITDMSQPLGNTVGNGLEIKECITALKGTMSEDIKENILILGSWMLYLADCVREKKSLLMPSSDRMEKYSEKLLRLIEDGSALKKFSEFIKAQNGDPSVIENPELIASAVKTREIKPGIMGYITKMDAEKVGTASMLLGAGRKKQGEPIDYSAGILLLKKIGDFIDKNEPAAVFYYNNDDKILLKEAADLFLSGIEINDLKPEKKSIIIEVIL